MEVIEGLIKSINDSAPVEKTLQDLIAASLVPQGIEIPKPDTVFGINGVPLMTKKSISTLIGRAKSGKTTVTSWLVAETIKKSVNVLWIDTEQGLYYGSRTQSWILNMCQLTTSDYLRFYDLKVFNPNKRIELIEEIIKMFKPDLVIVDGIRDLVFDINNAEEATLRTGDLMRWAEQYDCHILNILHQNKGNEHARGHLGTEMINKSETVIKVEQNEEKLIVCSPEYTRSAPFDVFAFDRDSYGMPQLVEGFAGKITTMNGAEGRGRGGRTPVDPTEPSWNAAHIDIVNHIFSKKEFLKYSELTDKIHHYMTTKGIKNVGVRKVREFITHYLDCGIIWEPTYAPSKTVKYQKNPTWLGFPQVPIPITNREIESPF